MTNDRKSLFNRVAALASEATSRLFLTIFSKDDAQQEESFIYIRLAYYVISAAIIFMTGTLTFIGFDFGTIIPALNLLESVGSITFYSVFVGVLSIFISETVIFLLLPIRFLATNFFSLIYRLLTSRDAGGLLTRVSNSTNRLLRRAVYAAISTMMLVVYVGPAGAALTFLVLFPSALYAWSLGWPKMLFSRAVMICLLLSIYNLGYQRALYSATRDFQFILVDTHGQSRSINIVLATSGGLIITDENPLSRYENTARSADPNLLDIILAAAEIAFGVKKTSFIERNNIAEIRKIDTYRNEFIRMGAIPQFLVGLATPFTAIKEGYVDSEKLDDLNSISDNITTSISNAPGLLTGLAYMMGILLGVLGILKIKDHVENPGNTPLQKGAIRLAPADQTSP